MICWWCPTQTSRMSFPLSIRFRSLKKESRSTRIEPERRRGRDTVEIRIGDPLKRMEPPAPQVAAVCCALQTPRFEEIARVKL